MKKSPLRLGHTFNKYDETKFGSLSRMREKLQMTLIKQYILSINMTYTIPYWTLKGSAVIDQLK